MGRALVPGQLVPLKRSRFLRPAVKADKCLVVLLDVSGSMGSLFPGGRRSKLQVAWEAFKEELAPRLQGWHLGILLFGTLEPPGVRWLVSPASKIELENMTPPHPLGGTPLLEALQQAFDWIATRAEAGRMIVLTDGVPDGGPAPVLAWARDHRPVPIDTVGVADTSETGWNPGFLRALSELTGGRFMEVKDAGSLAEAVLMLSPQQRPALGTAVPSES